LSGRDPLDRPRWILRILLGAAFVLAGVAHLRWPGPFLSITPAWVPRPELVIAATGVAELLGAGALVAVPRLRRAAAVGLALYAVCVFPANIKHAADAVAARGAGAWWPYHAPRLAFQPVIVWWALFAGGVISWPFGRRRPGTRSEGA
jgi:uncharacterized membrane protein